jgi:ABC-type nitrate/sulfonate/bicarbonate transport system ATPase subunit
MDINMQKILLEFRGVSKTFVDGQQSEVKALEDISFSVAKGEFISIIGPSGCGKSTLLRLAAGLENFTSGEVLYRGQTINGPSPERGFVFQSYSAFPWLSVRENIAFGLNSRENNSHEELVSKWLQLTGLDEFADCFPKALSGGMKQRLAIARAMIVNPKLLLLDEPFGALDERIRETMQQLLLKIVSDSHCTVLFVTHDIREAVLLGDQVLMLSPRPGRIVRSLVPNLPKPRTRQHLRSPELISMYETLVDSFPVANQFEANKENA